MKETTYEQLSQLHQKLLDEASRVMETAYNPYSHYYVGAALLTKQGKIISGSNVENAAYGSTICAERAAIMHANALGERLFDAIAIIARGHDFDSTTVTGPCGSCRQMLCEAAQVSEKNMDVILSTTRKNNIIITTIEELLPLAFGPRDLGVDVTRYQ